MLLIPYGASRQRRRGSVFSLTPDRPRQLIRVERLSAAPLTCINLHGVARAYDGFMPLALSGSKLMPSSNTITQLCADHSTYPALEWFVEAFDAGVIRAWVASDSAAHWSLPVALNIGIPTAPGIGCACEHGDRVDGSVCVTHLEREMALYRAARGERAKVCDMHWSASVTALPADALERLCGAIDEHFERTTSSSLSACVEPRIQAGCSLPALPEFGVTTLCIDCGRDWLAATNLLATARDMGFQAVEAYFCAESQRNQLHRQVDSLIAYGPTRIVLSAAFKQNAATRLLDAGYLCIARNVFALPSDTHAVAHRQGRLTRQPYGYSTRPVGAVLALGQQAIGYIGPLYYQNHRAPNHYFSALSRGTLPVERGLHLSHDDLARRAVISSLSANLFVDIAAIETAYGIEFRSNFGAEWQEPWRTRTSRRAYPRLHAYHT